MKGHCIRVIALDCNRQFLNIMEFWPWPRYLGQMLVKKCIVSWLDFDQDFLIKIVSETVCMEIVITGNHHPLTKGLSPCYETCLDCVWFPSVCHILCVWIMTLVTLYSINRLKMSYLYGSDALVPQESAKVEKSYSWQWYTFLDIQQPKLREIVNRFLFSIGFLLQNDNGRFHWRTANMLLIHIFPV